MLIAGSRNFVLGLMAATLLVVSMWSGAALAYTPEQQQACYARRDAAVRRLCSRRRSHHRLHDPEQVAALAGLPGVFPGRAGAGRGRWPADGYQAGGAQEHQAEEASEAGDLIDWPHMRHFVPAMIRGTIVAGRSRVGREQKPGPFQAPRARQTDALRGHRPSTSPDAGERW